MKNRMREYRNAAEMTQAELADEVHVTSRTIISLEQGRYNPSLLLAYRIARFFGTTVEEMFCLAENLEEDEQDG